MKLMTEEIKKKIPAIGSQEKVENPLVQVKFFCPWSKWTWYATEFDPTDGTFFGYVEGFENELGYFTLGELEGIKGPAGLKIERDLFFEPIPLKSIMK